MSKVSHNSRFSQCLPFAILSLSGTGHPCRRYDKCFRMICCDIASPTVSSIPYWVGASPILAPLLHPHMSLRMLPPQDHQKRIIEQLRLTVPGAAIITEWKIVSAKRRTSYISWGASRKCTSYHATALTIWGLDARSELLTVWRSLHVFCVLWCTNIILLNTIYKE